jgi:hypothetical protein
MAEVNWSVMAYQASTDAAEVERLLALARLAHPSRRWQALRGWVERHRSEIGSPLASGRGWGRLEKQVFNWLLESGDQEQRWATVRLYAELQRGALLRCECLFATPAGRAMLLRVARDDRSLLGDRTRALQLLGETATLWPSLGGKRSEVVLSGKERDALLDGLVGLLAETDDHCRAAAARAILSASRPPRADLAAPPTDRALPGLVSAYQASKPGPARDQLAEAVCAVAPAQKWKELTGNPPGVVACLRDLERAGDRMTFWLHLRPGGQRVYQAPEVVLERLGTLGFVAETRRLPLSKLNLERPWAAGWNGEDLLLAEVPLAGLQAGNWRMTVQGSVGKGKDSQKWVSERKLFTVAAPRNPRRGPYPAYRSDW